MFQRIRFQRDDWPKIVVILWLFTCALLLGAVILFLLMEGISRAINADLDATFFTLMGTPAIFMICYACYELMLHHKWTVGYRYTLLKPTIPALFFSTCTLPQLLQNIALNNSPYRERSGSITILFGDIFPTIKPLSSDPINKLSLKTFGATDAWYTSPLVQYGPAALLGIVFAGMCLIYFLRKTKGH